MITLDFTKVGEMHLSEPALHLLLRLWNNSCYCVLLHSVIAWIEIIIDRSSCRIKRNLSSLRKNYFLE